MIEQGTDEWRAQRLGKVTASRVHDIMPGKRGYKAARKNYMAELAIERLTGEPQDNGVNTAAMQWGTDNEPFARSEYEVVNDVMIQEVGFIDHPEIPNFGASPDGLVGEDGAIEIKCPNSATHIETLFTGKVKPEYFYQMHTVIMCTGRQWCDFFSFDPRMSDNLCRYQQRFYRDEVVAAEIKIEVEKFLEELNIMVKKLEEMRE